MRHFFWLAVSLFTSALLWSCSHKSANPIPVISPSPEKPRMIRMELKNAPEIGKTKSGQSILLGGFSGLRYLGKNESGHLRFLTLTDRGPNAKEIKGEQQKRPFLLPDYQPRIVELHVDLKSKELRVAHQLFLKKSDGKQLSGMPSRKGLEAPIDLHGKPLTIEPFGMDPEGIVHSKEDGSFWVAEEYGPSLAKFSSQGVLLERLQPGNGLPKVIEQTRLNRGFEGLASHGGKLYAILQSPLDNPRSPKEKNSKRSQVIRIIEVDEKEKQTTGQYAYLLEKGKADKIGDLTVLPDGRLLVLEQDGDEGANSFKKAFAVTLEGASNLQLVSQRVTGVGGTLEQLSLEGLKKEGITPVKKDELFDLTALGIREEKAEGIEVVEDQFLAVIVDNDFGLAGGLDQKTGEAEFKDEKPALYLFPLETK